MSKANPISRLFSRRQPTATRHQPIFEQIEARLFLFGYGFFRRFNSRRVLSQKRLSGGVKGRTYKLALVDFFAQCEMRGRADHIANRRHTVGEQKPQLLAR